MTNQIGGSIVWNLDVDDSKYNAGLAKAKASADTLAKEVDNKFSSIASSITDAFKRAEGASLAFAGGLVAVGAAGFGAIGFGVKMAGDIEAARQGFVTLLGSAKLADEAIAQIKKDAAATPFEFSNLVRANQMLTSVTKNAPKSERLLLNVGKALSAAGKSSTELDNVIVNLQQIANTGKISELDIRQFGFAGINILELLADQYGVTKDVAGEMVKTSKNAFADLESAFIKAGEGGGRFSRAFIDQAGTFKQLMSNFRDIVSQTAADIVTKTGIFDSVKDAIGGITQKLVEFKPQITQGIKDFIAFISANGPIVVGIIAGGLAPAFVGLAIAIGSSVLALAPFLIIGAAIGLLAKYIIDNWATIGPMFDAVAKLLTNLLGPSLREIWSIIQTQLIPQLKELWATIGPVLIPVLKGLAVLIAGVVIGAIYLIVEVLKTVIQWVSNAVTGFNNLIDFFKTIKASIEAAFSSVYDAITKPFKDAWSTIKDIAGKIKGELDKISPFHRNSPSLIDNVMRGVGIIKDQYSSLEKIQLPAIAHVMPSLAESPTLQGSSSLASSPQQIYGKNAGIDKLVNIEKMEVHDESDITGVARELGYHIERSTGFTQ